MIRIEVKPTGPGDIGYSPLCPRVTACIYVDGAPDYLCSATDKSRAVRGVVEGTRAMRSLRRAVQATDRKVSAQ